MLKANTNVGSSEDKQTIQFVGLLDIFSAKNINPNLIKHFEVHEERFIYTKS